MINKIATHLQNGGLVYETQLDMFVLAYFNTPLQKYVILGDLDTKHLYVQMNEGEFGDYDFVFIDKEEMNELD